MNVVLESLKNWQKTLIVMIYDFIFSCITYWIAFSLRLGEVIPDRLVENSLFLRFILVGGSQLICFYLMGHYRGVWRFSSTHDLMRIIRGVSLAVPVSFLTLFVFNQLSAIPRSIFIIQWFLLVVFVGGSRFAYRMYRDRLSRSKSILQSKGRKTLIVGAGYAGQQLVKHLQVDAKSDFNLLGFVDDDFGKRKKIIHGIKVLGNVGDIPQIAKKFDITHVVIAIPTASKEQISRIVKYCDGTNLHVRTIPKVSDIISGKVEISKLRKVTPVDLLGRDQVDLNMQSLSHMLTDKTIIVTGAGGSIGSELCNQIAKFKPKLLICVDISELNLYELGFKLENYKEFTNLDFIVGDVRSSRKVDSIFDNYRPDIVFHAAAYKHVPMMEMNPIESIKTNVFGTKVVAEAADKYKLDKFVLVSTDKAVNPTNVMGTTKRVAEMVCQKMQERSQTKFAIVRFGNVLGSSGSVIPRFQKQIEAGGPVTVTHPDIIRYFMSIPEAAQLVIQAGALGNGGEIFVLDMGEPVKIVDLAKQMVTLAGLKVDEDIEIEFTGLRPGEKLFEELLADSEETLPTAHERVRVAKVRVVDESFDTKLSQLVQDQDESCIRTKLKNIVPEYDIPEDLIDKNQLSYSSHKIN